MTMAACLLTLQAVPAMAQNNNDATRYVTRTTLYGIGYANVYDTYLSPQEYSGTDLRIARETMRMTALGGGNTSVQSFFQANIAYTHNKADNNNTFSGLVNWNYGMHYHFRLTNNFKLLVGGLGDINAGFVYNLRNTNNPASARAYLNLNASAMAIWQIPMARKTATLRWQVNLPVAGVMFSPNYGQSYYEIFTLGNDKGVIRFTSLHNQPSMRTMLSLDYPVGSIKLRGMLLGDIQQARVNGLENHTYGYVFMLGVVKNLYRLSSKDTKNLPTALRAY